jgi:hypothetical protein
MPRLLAPTQARKASVRPEQVWTLKEADGVRRVAMHVETVRVGIVAFIPIGRVAEAVGKWFVRLRLGNEVLHERLHVGNVDDLALTSPSERPWPGVVCACPLVDTLMRCALQKWIIAAMSRAERGRNTAHGLRVVMLPRSVVKSGWLIIFIQRNPFGTMASARFPGVSFLIMSNNSRSLAPDALRSF